MRIYLSPPEVSEADIDSVVAAMRSGWIAPTGPALQDFEEKVARQTGRKHAVALSSGTAALHLALRAAGVGPGDTVILPTMTFAAPAFAVRYCGAEPFWVDVDPKNWQMEPELLAEAIAQLRRGNKRVGAVVAVDLYGQCGDWPVVEQLCAEAGIPLIEDAAEALGAGLQVSGAFRAAGSWGQGAAISFNGNKILTTSGGGMWVGDDEACARRIRKWASQSREPAVHYEHHEIGYNYRMSNLLAALGCSQMDQLVGRVEKRKKIYSCYLDSLGQHPAIEGMPIPRQSLPNYWLSCLLIDPEKCSTEASSIQRSLHANGIESRPLWKPLHQQKVFAGTKGLLSGEADRLFRNGLCLPSGACLSSEQQAEIVEHIQQMLE